METFIENEWKSHTTDDIIKYKYKYSTYSRKISLLLRSNDRFNYNVGVIMHSKWMNIKIYHKSKLYFFYRTTLSEIKLYRSQIYQVSSKVMKLLSVSSYPLLRRISFNHCSVQCRPPQHYLWTSTMTDQITCQTFFRFFFSRLSSSIYFWH